MTTHRTVIHGSLRLLQLDTAEDYRCEPFLASHPDALVSHHPAYLEALRQGFGYEPMYLACEDERGSLRGVFPLVKTRGLLARPRLSSLPYTSVAGPLATDDEAAAALIEEAAWLCRDEFHAGFEIKTWTPALEEMSGGLVAETGLLTYTLCLPERLEHLRFGPSRSHAAIKRAVNKAERLGVQIREAESKSDLRAWYDLYLATMRHHGVPPRPLRYLEACFDLLHPLGLMRLLLAEQVEGEQRRVLAGSVFFQYGSTVFYALNGRRHEDLHLRPNDAIHWRAIHDAVRDGYRLYDFGPVAGDDDSLARFKTKWGAEPRQLYRYVNSDAQGSGLLRRGSFTRRAASSIWRRLPLRLTQALGDRIWRAM